MRKNSIRKYLDPLARTHLANRIGKAFLRVGEYIRRVNKEEDWNYYQEVLSPINWGFEDLNTNKQYIKRNDKIRVRIFHQQASMWNAISSVYSQFAKDEKYDILVILTGSSYNLCAQIEQMEEIKATYIVAKDYNFKFDKPDILILYNSWVWYSFPTNLWEARQNTKLIIEIPLWTRENFGTISLAHRSLYWNEINPDYCIVDRYMYEKYKEFDPQHEYILFGHPKTDVVYQYMHNHNCIPASWEKIREKRTLVFVTDHGLTLNGVYQDCAFDIYGKDIFKFFSQHKEYALIFRPHDSYINDLLHSFWSFADYQYLRKMIEKSENIIWDDTNNFALAYSIADAVISDLNCDLTASAILIDKPVAVLHRNDMETKAYSPEITDCYTNIFSSSELMQFLEEFMKGEDPNRETRTANFHNVTCSFDGKNGVRIKEFIEDKYFQ